MVSHLMREARGQFCHPDAHVLQRRGNKEAMGYFELADHSIELSTRKVVVTEWTGLRIRCSVDMSRLLSDWARQVQVRLPLTAGLCE